MGKKDVDVACLFMVVNPWVNVDVVKSGEMEVIKTMGIDAGCLFMVVNPQVKVKAPEQRLMDMQPSMEIKDMDAGCPFMVMNPWVKADVRVVHMHPYMKVNPFVVVNPWLMKTHRRTDVDMEVIKAMDMVNPLVKPDVVNSGEVIKTICMDAGCPSMVVNPREMSL
jgi:hypothetical protein